MAPPLNVRRQIGDDAAAQLDGAADERRRVRHLHDERLVREAFCRQTGMTVREMACFPNSRALNESVIMRGARIANNG